MKKNWLIFIILSNLFFFSCSSDIDNSTDDTKKSEIEEYVYSKDPNIIYANNNAETAFSNQGEMIELSNGMFVKKISDDAYIFDSDMLLTVCLQAKVHQSHLSVLYFKPS